MFGQELAEIRQFEIIIYTGSVTLMSITSKNHHAASKYSFYYSTRILKSTRSNPRAPKPLPCN